MKEALGYVMSTGMTTFLTLPSAKRYRWDCIYFIIHRSILAVVAETKIAWTLQYHPILDLVICRLKCKLLAH